MTVATKLKQTLAALKGARATLETYAVHHPEDQMQEVFRRNAEQAEQLILQLQQRLKEIEFEEPQYKGF